MRSRQLQACLAVAVLLFALPAAAASKEEQRVADSADVLDQFLRIPEQSIPPAILARAYAVAVVPSVVRIGFGLGARRGKGILVRPAFSGPMSCWSSKPVEVWTTSLTAS